MNLERIYNIVDIENGSEFEYFENFESLIESLEEIESDEIYLLLKEVNLDVFEELTESYFYDLMENIPGEEIDLYNLLETIKRNFIGLANSGKNEDESSLLRLSDEIFRFRQWLNFDLLCQIENEGEYTTTTVSDAIATARLGKLEQNLISIDFEKALDYPIDEYIMTYGDMVTEEE